MYDKTPGRTIEYHRSMLADRVRTERYREAIAASVKPGDVVLDLGCGTGILAFFACQAGAARVYAVEMGLIIEIARSVCRANGFDDRVVFYNELSTRVQLPERVDVVITETLGNFGLDEGILGSVMDARQRFLKEGGRIIPRSVELSIVPVELPGVYDKVDLWSDELYGLDFSAARALAVNNPNWVELPRDALLSQPVAIGRFELAAIARSEMQAEASFLIERDGVLHGIGGWFAAELSPGICLSNQPPLDAPSWRQAFFSLDRPVRVEAGDCLHVTVGESANGGLWRWRVRCTRSSGSGAETRQIAAFDQSSFFGQLLSSADLKKRCEAYRPQLTDVAQADLFILQSMDGSSSLVEIALHVVEMYPALFPDSAGALDRVRDLSRKHSR